MGAWRPKSREEASPAIWLGMVIGLALVVAFPRTTMATEKAKYTVVHDFKDFEIRDYPPAIVAETDVESDFEDAGNEGFRRLFAYISGSNSRRQPISMTAPVTQSDAATKMAGSFIERVKTASYAVSFLMPSNSTIENLPLPKDNRVKIRRIPAVRFASIRYSGFWSQGEFDRNLKKLVKGVEREHFRMTGSPVWARYDPPFIPWFMRRNEILIAIARP